LKGKLFVISGPSGSGKTTLAKYALADRELKHKLAKSVSFTTRPKRPGERNGKDYLFIGQAEFKRNIRTKKIIEWTDYLGYYYGTAREFLERQLKKPQGIILCLDLKGAKRIKRLYPQNTVTIFVLPPSVEELARRIAKRCRSTKNEEVRKRIKLARQEIKVRQWYDFCLVNHDLEAAIAQLKVIINNSLG
jgi:guanylate kinase